MSKHRFTRDIGFYGASVGMVTLGMFMALWGGCASQTTENARLTSMGPLPMHAIHSDALQREMRNLSRQASSPEDVRIDSIAGRPGPDMSNLAAMARSMRRTARNLPDMIGNLNMSPEDRQNFCSLATELERAANDLKIQAEQNNLAGAKAALERVNNTCTACHSTFRMTQADQ